MVTSDNQSEAAYIAISADKQAKRDCLIPEEWRIPQDKLPSDQVLDVIKFPVSSGLLTQEEIKITETSAVDLVKAMQKPLDEKDRWSSTQVVTAFCKRASIAQQLVNCLTEICFEEALSTAKHLDTHFEKTGKPVGPLHGLPVSIKDNFKIKGLDSTLGFACWANDPMSEDSLLISILRESGAVLYCKTNVPTAMMIAESINNVWGRTLNPYNRSCTSGGSSGGESALLALKGSPLGVGTDIGGSIRIPSSLTALYSIKPSLGRFPTHNARSGMAGQEAVNSINGPMSSDFSSLDLFAAAVVGKGPWRLDPKAIPIPWKSKEEIRQLLPSTGLVFGVIRNNGMVRPLPPVQRALDITIKALRDKGHEVVEWKSEDEFKTGLQLIGSFFTADGGSGIYDLMEKGGEEKVWVQGLPKATGKPKTISETWKLQAERTTWAGGICEKWESLNGKNRRTVDALLSPATPFAAVPNGTFDHIAYTGVWNVMDFPGTTFPVTRADASLDQPSSAHGQPLSEPDEKIWKNYNAEVNQNHPVSLQLVGRRLEEEKLLEITQILMTILRYNNA